MGRKNQIQEAIAKIEAEIEAQQRVLSALLSIQTAQGKVGKRASSKKRRDGEAATTTVSGNYQP